MTETPEQDRLRARLIKMGALGLGVDWAPEAASMSAEERASALNAAFDAIDAGDYEELADDEDCALH